MALTTEHIAKIEKLRAMTQSRGASAGEEQNARLLIGKLVMEHGLTAESEHNGYKNGHARAENTNARVTVHEREVWITQCEVLEETDKALLVRLDLPNITQEWFPKSQCAPNNELMRRGDRGTLKVTLWIARQKGLV